MLPPIIGYCDPLRGRPGDTINFHISSADGLPFDARLVRVICGDPNPAGPGLRMDAVPSAVEGRHDGKAQSVPIGSCARAPLPALGDAGAMVLILNLRPTRLDTDLRAIASLQDEAGRSVLAVALEGRRLVLVLRRQGEESRTVTGLELDIGAWHSLGLGFSHGRSAVVVELARLDQRRGMREVRRQVLQLAGEVGMSQWTQVAFAAIWAGKPTASFNGQIERPALRRGLEPRLAETGGALGVPVEDALALWDFSGAIDEQRFPERLGHGDGVLVNVPTRAVRGSNWDGSELCWRHAPAHYGAIHFHDDDLADCQWEPGASFAIPPDLESGIYALEVQNAQGRDTIPFFVLPARDGPKKPIAVLASTFTYLAYANHARGNFEGGLKARAAAWGAYPWNSDEVPDFALSTYNYHSDGSGVSLSSRLRPIMTMRPGYLTFDDQRGSGLRHFPADTHLVAWLHRKGYDFDIVTDEDLDDDGVAAIAGYQVVVTGSHPEYHTERSLNALQDYREAGGHFAYLGGNGFYWRIGRRGDLPHMIEIRRAESGIRAWACRVGEYYQQLDGAYGGLWRRNDRPPQMLAGIGFAIQGLYEGSYYRRTAESRDPAMSWLFEGVGGDILGDYGLFGGGAAGFELDQVSEPLGTPAGTVVVARSAGHGPSFQLAPEEILTHTLALTTSPGVEAHMVLGTPPGEGAFFASGSITFIGSLSHNGDDNDVSRILDNVLRRFLSLPAG
ncbi:N,N-dimethylformamidase beta subunit family domain-containing protein [Phreatobacter stygius]|uniref:N,N-dimethylformamidase large subunit n=1 Tax=Phreatobacter stygius TaxID=1940610 RepID=A0A4D7AXK3_9HYPH|nr:N,N-dimethylformamidase beta subunit family domain-containing protein [Phreatobacter stygius]QCI66304.1 N,N-dimethylformamidase large subunit [Phreatobacter stygius]